MILETVESPGLAQLSYLIGDQGAGTCAVIDPRRDVEVYLRLAREHGLRIDRVLETHVHADFVCGTRELAARTGAPILVGAEGDYDYGHEGLEHGDEVRVGDLALRALHTPGHSPEHMSYAVRDAAGDGEAWGVFTGDTLFAGSVGRPDLSTDHDAEELAARLYHSIHDVLLPLGDEVLVYPGHGAGSPCGANIGDRRVTTLGHERVHDGKLGIQSEDDFVDAVLADLPEEPTYYARMKRLNAAGSEARGGPRRPRPLAPGEFRQAIDAEDAIVVDTREIEAFGAAHVDGAINLALRDSFPVWAGWILQPGQRLYLIGERSEDTEETAVHLFRIGLDDVAGALLGGMQAWIETGLPYASRRDMSVHDLHRHLRDGDGMSGLQLLDVRSRSEWRQGHLPGARHAHAPRLLEGEGRAELDPRRPVITYCGTGYRASLAASLLERRGFEQVGNVPGSIQAWKAAGYPLERPEASAAGA